MSSLQRSPRIGSYGSSSRSCSQNEIRRRRKRGRGHRPPNASLISGRVTNWTAPWSRKRVVNPQGGEAGGRPFMRSQSLSRSRMSTPGWGSASQPSSFSVYPRRRDLMTRACRRSSLTRAARLLPCCAAVALSRFRRSSSIVRVVRFMHQNVYQRRKDVKVHFNIVLMCGVLCGRPGSRSSGVLEWPVPGDVGDWGRVRRPPGVER